MVEERIGNGRSTARRGRPFPGGTPPKSPLEKDRHRRSSDMASWVFARWRRRWRPPMQPRSITMAAVWTTDRVATSKHAKDGRNGMSNVSSWLYANGPSRRTASDCRRLLRRGNCDRQDHGTDRSDEARAGLHTRGRTRGSGEFQDHHRAQRRCDVRSTGDRRRGQNRPGTRARVSGGQHADGTGGLHVPRPRQAERAAHFLMEGGRVTQIVNDRAEPPLILPPENATSPVPAACGDPS